jgi:glycolate oxidase iron-sulfur subunit
LQRHYVDTVSMMSQPGVIVTTPRLHLDDSELATCVSCGLCLPHCPTYRATGEEGLSPRGRIDAMRSVHWRGAEIDDEFVRFMETCVQCRGCEPACPSGVPFGHLMAGTRDSLASLARVAPRRQRLAMKVLGHHRLLLVGSTLLAIAQRLRLVPRRLGLTRLPLRRGPRGGLADGTVVLFTGCVMDAWMRSTHRATDAVLTEAGAMVQWSPDDAPCCGSLHAHAGLLDDARTFARDVIAALPGDALVLVNSAGCGAAMKEYGHLLGTAEAAAFSARVRDVHEWLAERVDRLPAGRVARRPVIVQDPCHLRHVQRAEGSVRRVLSRYFDVVELDDEGLCCGAGGAYSALQPELAGAIRERKLGAIERAVERSGASIVASANPGCAMHLGAKGVDTRHPMDLVAEAIRAPR